MRSHPVAIFSQESTAELTDLIGLYCPVLATLNGFDVPEPEDA